MWQNNKTWAQEGRLSLYCLKQQEVYWIPRICLLLTSSKRMWLRWRYDNMSWLSRFLLIVRGQKIKNMVKFHRHYLRRTKGIAASMCYVVRWACAVAFVLPLSMDYALMEARYGLLPLFKGRGNSGKMTHNVPGLYAVRNNLQKMIRSTTVIILKYF